MRGEYGAVASSVLISDVANQQRYYRWSNKVATADDSDDQDIDLSDVGIVV
ncbi:hypothetical protein SAMN05192552_100749 [Natrinema hispanicum]|uniref:Uncharacterized protein n=1 Tax=Natrinema hispanicum TaxID=392421 RepID=A0A1G6PBA6_9EURY|nr:hypothetical protein SAMN05192552_100749 [Natrinema hispanicum]SET59876.1 hypothetical protein SAMN04488694_10922 [Natrinema hispanicum]